MLLYSSSSSFFELMGLHKIEWWVPLVQFHLLFILSVVGFSVIQAPVLLFSWVMSTFWAITNVGFWTKSGVNPNIEVEWRTTHLS